ncbi:hypothetical protein [Luteolibacter sp. Populi]|uniref:hypothetical protein n=1 Tax=Luteolibacter sp. Populi TaxID=3230487 RepID=UPI0034677AEA
MAEFIDKVATEWIEVRAKHVCVRKGHPTFVQLKQLRELFAADGLPVASAFWITRDKRIHFKPNFPASLRPAVRAIMDS